MKSKYIDKGFKTWGKYRGTACDGFYPDLDMIPFIKEQGDPRMFGKGYIYDEYQYSDPRTRVFYERYMRGEKIRAECVNESDFEKQPLD